MLISQSLTTYLQKDADRYNTFPSRFPQTLCCRAKSAQAEMIPIIPNYASSEVSDVPINWFAFALMLVVILFIFGACCFGTQMLLRDKKQEEERVFLLQDMEPTAEDEEPNEEKSTETVEDPAIIHDLA
ncbi:unnamed protein product [Caenorhabditis brenneri]